MLKKNDDIQLKIDGMSTEGTGVGHHEGQAVFVSNTAVGDVIACHIIKAKKNYAVGKAMDILTPSDDRIETDCPVSKQCGGCCYRHITYEAELKYKKQRVEDAFRRIGHIDTPISPIIGSPEQLHYRNKAQFPVSKDAIGFYAFNSHRIVPCTDCLLQPEEFKGVLNIIQSWMTRTNITAYDESSHKGTLRHIYLRQGFHTKELMVSLVVNDHQADKKVLDLVEDLKTNPNFKTFVLNYNTKDTNVILGSENEVLYGDGYIEDTLLEKTFRISPLSFYQVNTAQCEVLYQKAAQEAGLTGKEFLLDLYCGTGTIGLTMADKAKRLIGVEIIPEAIEDAKKNAKQNHITNAEFFCGDAAKVADKLKKDHIHPDVILIDPPRKGMDEALVSTVASMAPDRIVYVSCDPATLARDCARLLEHGYQTKHITPVDMFPRTAHVETVVLLVRECEHVPTSLH